MCWGLKRDVITPMFLAESEYRIICWQVDFRCEYGVGSVTGCGSFADELCMDWIVGRDTVGQLYGFLNYARCGAG